MASANRSGLLTVIPNDGEFVCSTDVLDAHDRLDLYISSRVAGEALRGRAGRWPRPSGDCLPLALSRPREALARARAVLAGQPDPL